MNRSFVKNGFRGLQVHTAELIADCGYAPKGVFIQTKYPCQNVASLKMTQQKMGDSEFTEKITIELAESMCTAVNETYSKGINPEAAQPLLEFAKSVVKHFEVISNTQERVFKPWETQMWQDAEDVIKKATEGME